MMTTENKCCFSTKNNAIHYKQITTLLFPVPLILNICKYTQLTVSCVLSYYVTFARFSSQL